MKSFISQPVTTRAGRQHCVLRQAMILAAIATVALAGKLAAQTYTLVLSNKWTIAPGSTPILPTTGGNPRSMAINRVTGNLLVPSLVSSNHVQVFSGANGADMGSLNNTAVTATGTLTLLGIGVADDGVIYAGNLTTANTMKIYRWPAEDTSGTVVPTVAFGGAGGAVPGAVNARCGDSFFVRGSGTNTQIIASGTGDTHFTIFTTTDGTNFTANQFTTPATPGSGGLNRTVAFDGTNNAFWGGKPNDTKLYNISFNLSTLTAATVSNLTLTTAMGMCALRSTNGVTILAGIQDAGGSTHKLLVYDTSNLSATAQGGSVSFPAGGTADGNITGQADIGAGMVAGFNTQNGMVALNIYLLANSPPAITTAPVGTSGVFPTYNLSVGASGTQPLAYQWLASNSGTNISTTFTNIPSATNTSFAVTSARTNYFEVIVTNNSGAVTSAPVLVALLTPVTSTAVTQLWKVAAGANGYNYLNPTDNNSRGLGYDTNRQRLVVASITGGSGLYIVDANTGTNLGSLSLSGVSFGGLIGGVDQVVVADDGVVYAGNLVSGSGFTLNSWPAPTNGALGSPAFLDNSGVLGGDRWGDTMAVRGAGINTQIILGSRGGTNVALLTTTDGINFSGALMAISNAPAGFAANGIAFGAGNTLWAKANLGHLYQVAFDPLNGVGGVLLDYSNPGQIPTYQVGVGIDSANGILAGIDLADLPNDVKLYQLTGTSDAPVLFNQSFFASGNGNGNANVAIAMKYPRLFALDVNNGLQGLTYGVPPTTLAVVTAAPANQLVYSNNPAVVLSATYSGSLPLYYQWQFSLTTNAAGFANIAGANGSTYTLNYPGLNQAGYYQVIVHNVGGYATSTPPAQLSVLIPTTSVAVTQLWTLPAGSLPFLDGSSYNTRGLAYDNNSGTVLVADHFNIHLLAATNGNYLGDLNVIGIAAPGYNGWLFDQIGVADDGTLYAGNLAGVAGSGLYSIVSWPPGYAPGSPATGYAYGGGTGADPGNGSGERWGDSMDVRGSGTSTEILIGGYNYTNVVLFTTTDGATFTANVIAVTNVPGGFSGQGIAFGDGDTFYAKSPGYLLRKISFNRSTWTGGAYLVYLTMPSAFGGIDVDVAANILGGVNFSDSPNDLQLYQLSGNSNGPALFHQAFFGSVTVNSQDDAVTTLKGGKGFALNVNNGVTAISYGVPAAPATTITSVSHQSGVGTTLTWTTFNGRTYQVQYRNSLTSGIWANIGPATIASGAMLTYVDSSATGDERFYRVISQ